MAFQYIKAVRKNTYLLIGLAGASGSGKTYSAMQLATGICGSDPFLVLDTEARRALHYADQYNFEHQELGPPFHPSKYLDSVRAGAERGFRCIVIDSASHEWEGEGGVIEQAEADPRKSPGNWIKPKAAHHRMVNGFLQAKTHLIFCLRAQEKIIISTIVDPRGKATITTGDWQPICEKRFMYEMTASFTLNPLTPGVVDLGLPHKLQDQHRMSFLPGQHISVAAGQLLAAWALGKPVDQPDKELWNRARRAAHEGMDSLRKFAGELPQDDRNKLKPIRQELVASGNRADQNLAVDDFVMDAAWWAQTFAAMRTRLLKAIGEEPGDDEYRSILQRHNMTPDDLGEDQEKLKAAYHALGSRTIELEREKRG